MAKKTPKNKTTPKRYIPRQTRKFQLRMDHAQDVHVREVLDYAKSQRREVTLIREAITLYYALENGNLDALFEKFPAFKASFAPQIIAPPASGEGQLDEIKGLLKMIADQQQSNNGYLMQTTTALEPVTAGPKKLGNFKALAAPQFDDDDMPTMIIANSTDTSAATNMLNSLRALHQS